MSGEINLHSHGILDKFQNQLNSKDINDQINNADYEYLYQYANQLSNLFISMNITSISDINTELNLPNKNINELNQLINTIIKKLTNLGIPPNVAIGSKPTTTDIYNLLSFASLLLYNQKSKNPPISKNQINSNINVMTNSPKSVSNAQMFALENEIETYKIKNQGLTEECQKRRLKINDLQAENNELQNKNQEQEKEIYRLKLKINQAQIENEAIKTNKNIELIDNFDLIRKNSIKQDDELNSIKKELKIKTNENQKLNKALNELSKEMEKNSSNLTNELIQKNKFISIVQKQLLILDGYERIYQSLQMKVKKTEASLQAAQLTIKELESKNTETNINNNNNSDLFESLKIYFKTKSDKNNRYFNTVTNIINAIQNDTKTSKNENYTYNKLVEIFELLFGRLKELDDKFTSNNFSTEIADLTEMQRIKKVNDRLSQYVMSMVQFFEHLANSSEMQSWMIELPCTDDLRPLLLQQCSKVETFVNNNKYCKNIYKEQKEKELNKIDKVNNKEKVLDLITLPSLVENFLSNTDHSSSTQNDDDNFIHSLFGTENEFLVILHLCASANDALRRCLQHMIESNRLLTNEVKMLRHEVQMTNKDVETRINETNESFEVKIKEKEELLQNAETLLHNIQDELRRSEQIDPKKANSKSEIAMNKDIIKKCIALLNGDDLNLTNEYYENSEISTYEYSNNESDISEIKKVAANKIDDDKFHKEVEALKRKIQSYEKKNLETENLEKRNKLLEDDRKRIAQELTNSIQKLKGLKKKFENIQNENQTLKDEIQSLRQSESELRRENITVSGLTEEIETLRQKNEDLNSTIEKEKKMATKAIKSKIKNLQSEIFRHQQENEELKNHFESSIKELTIKLKDSEEINRKTMKNEQELTLQNKALSSELSTAKVDLKMLQMKLKAIEEKSQRDNKLIEAQCKMKLLNYQTKYQADIENIKSNCDLKIHNFQVNVIQHFKEFVNCRNTINEEAVFDVLDQVSSEMTKYNQMRSKYKMITGDIKAIKSIVNGTDESSSQQQKNDGDDSNDQLLIDITELVRTRNLYNQLKSDFDNLFDKYEKSQSSIINDEPLDDELESLSVYDWENWARKLSALISDDFLAFQNDRELQFSIEEALLGSINQRMMTKKLEILRIEKKIFNSGLLNDQRKNNQGIKLNTLIIVISSIRSLQKISGHLPCSIVQPIRGLEKMKKKNQK